MPACCADEIDDNVSMDWASVGDPEEDLEVVIGIGVGVGVGVSVGVC